ncbi:MAG: type II toxin-antitoxin system prevent-host-death family antitoxin [Patescibacteria group bacterium]
MSNIIGLKDLRENTEKYISAVGKGRSFTVVRRSRPVFRLLPVDESQDEGVWETVLDLTRGKNASITAGELLRMIKKSNVRQGRKVS